MARCGVCFILCLPCLAASQGWQNEPQIKTAGATIRLDCDENFPVHWCYPRVYTDNCTEKQSTGNVDISYSTAKKYKGRLVISNATYADTGYYFCVSNETAECDIKMEAAQRKYIYVKDNENLLAGSKFCGIKGEVQGNTVLPCRPTSPDIKITLSKDGNTLSLVDQEGVDQRIAYDPTIGFTLKKLEISDSGTYECQVDDSKPEFSAILDLRVSKRKPTYALKPMITGPQHLIVRKGKNLVLECKGLADEGITIIVMWLQPNRLQRNTFPISCNEGNYNCIITTLSIKNVTENDGGTYTCVVTDQHNNTKNDSRTVTVIAEEGEVGISLESDSSDTMVIQAGEAKEVKIVVNVLAPENVTLNWYGPQGYQLYSDGRKYDIESRYDQTILKVFDVTLYDAGVYRLDAYNGVGKESLNRQVIVLDSPNVSLSHDLSLYLLDSSVNFGCVVWSPKPVEVKLLFKACDLRKPRDCDVKKNFRQEGSGKYVNGSLKAHEILNFSLTVQQGILRCVANNSFGSGSDEIKLYVTDHPQVSQTPHLWGEPENVVLEVEDAFSVVDGDNFTLNCASSVYNNTQHPQWFMQSSTVHNSTGLTVTYSKTEFLYLSSLEFFNVTKKQHTAEYVCYENNNTVIPLGKQILVSDADEAKIVETNLRIMEVSLGDSVNLTCRSTGKPEPETLWYKDGELVVNSTTVELRERNQSLNIALVKPENEGKYSCVVKNRLHKESSGGYVKIADKKDLTPVMTGIIVVCLFGFLVLIVALIVKVQKQKKLKEELNQMGLANFEMGAPESINPELPVDEQADLLPYDRTWEFPREKLVLGKQLGSGAFGVVMKAEAYGIVDYEEKTNVAVKMVKSGVDRSFIKTLAAELKIMTHLGKHLNVVNLLGASTKSLAKMELMVIVEYCRYGNLHNYLLRHRDDFIDQLDRTTGKLNLALGIEKITRSQSSTKKTNLKHRFLSSASSLAGVTHYGDSSFDLGSPSPSNMTEVSRLPSDMTVMSFPTGQPEECLLSSGSSEQPNWRVKYGSDYTGTTTPVCSQDLLCWAFQVSRGMEYLASRKVLHGDLAARNILLADDNVVKICDFGLAKSMYKSDNYRKKSAGPLPVKWMALESIRDRVFSTQSDVWSFGIVLWELFSLAQTPYPGMEAGERLFLKLVNGYRMEQPPYATNAIYRTMLQCWNANPLERPSFTELAEQLGVMLDDNIRRHYEELNNPYVDMNEQNQRIDYLNMMRPHNYSNIIAPHEAEYDCDNSPSSYPAQNTRHLKMRSSTGAMSPLSADISVFEFSGEIDNPCYLNMTGKGVIFSPGHMDENPFKHFPHLQEEQAAQVQHHNEMNYPNSDNHPEGPMFEEKVTERLNNLVSSCN